jgi:type IV pilus assembly protein PilA
VILQCPKCQARHDVAQRRPGESFSCPCGHVLAAPKKSGMSVVLIVLLACAVPCLVGGVVVAGIAVPNFMKYQGRAKASEAKINVMAISTAEIAYFAEHDKYVAAGPAPLAVPRGVKATFTPDDGFTKIGWRPENQVRYQYEVRLGQTDREAWVIARGDLNGDGVTSEFKLQLDASGRRGVIEERDPLE